MFGSHSLTCVLAADTSIGSGIETMIWRLGLVLVGALVGAFVGHFAVKYGYRALGMKQVHHPVKVVGRLCGAIVVGLLVFLWCFSGGGSGWLGGGGGLWPFGAPFGAQGGPDNSKGNDNGKDKEKNKDTITDKKKTEDGPPSLIVHMLGGNRVRDEKFYFFDQQPPATFEDIKAGISREKDKNRNLKRVEIRVYQDSVASNSAPVAMLKDWIAEQDLTPVVATPPANAP